MRSITPSQLIHWRTVQLVTLFGIRKKLVHLVAICMNVVYYNDISVKANETL